MVDLIVLTAICALAVTGGFYVATQPVTPSQRAERENELIRKLDETSAWMRSQW